MLQCPECSSQRVWKDGHRQTVNGDIQRYSCRDCGFRFSIANGFAKPFYTPTSKGSTCQIGATQKAHGLVINLAEVEPLKEGPAGATASQNEANLKGKIIEHAFWMKKEGYAENTISRRIRLLTTLVKRGADLFDPESVKATIAEQQNWSIKTKEIAVETYSCLLQMLGGTWHKPHYKSPRRLPFIPTEQEINELIAGCNKKTATFLQLLKETGARCGEAWMLKWTDFNFESKTVNITPEKGSEPRMLKISDKLSAMLYSLPRDSQETFKGVFKHFVRGFRSQRSRVAFKLKNDRINKITFHTFRHWKATMEYAKTKDILHVMKILGHKSIQSTLLYTQLVNFESDDYHSATAKSVEEAQKLVEAGFEYVCDFDETKLFRKRK